MTPTIRKPFCVFALYVGVLLHLRGPINKSIVEEGPESIIRVGAVVFVYGALYLSSFEALIVNEVRGSADSGE